MLNTSVWILIFILLIIIKYVFIVPYNDRKLYRMYKARDDVALLATKNVISQESEEYNFVMDTMRFEIYYCKGDYNFAVIFRNLFTRPLRTRESFNKLIAKVEENQYLRKAFGVSYNEFVSSMNLRLKLFTFTVLYPLYFLIYITLCIIEAMDKYSKLLRIAVKRIGKAYDKIRFTIKDNRDYLKMNPYKI